MHFSDQSCDENAVNSLQIGIRRVLTAQVLISAILAIAILIALGTHPAISSGYGALLGFLSAVVTGRSVMRSSESAVSRPSLALLPVYSGMLQKLLIAALGVGIGIKLLNLQPIFILSGLLVTQFAYVFAVRNNSTKRTNISEED
ncbi:MAG: hypothetical protein ACI8P9_000773 [Parasphingorhabdus sp.]|jgi:hypothetical protein